MRIEHTYAWDEDFKEQTRNCRFLNTGHWSKIWGGCIFEGRRIFGVKNNWQTGTLFFSELDWLVLIKSRIFKQNIIEVWQKNTILGECLFQGF